MLYDLENELKNIYTVDELEKIKSSLKNDKKACVFLNKIKCSNKELEDIFKKENIKFKKLDKYCYEIDEKSKASQSVAFKQGLFYIQNFSSYLCAKNLNVSKNDTVLDMCAAPGGKSINLANFMDNEGYLSCVELSKDRFFKLKNNLQNYGVKNARIFCKNALSIGKICPLKFDKILLDAPCSSFSKLGFSIKRNKKDIKNIAKLQKKLLHSALNALKINGELIYSTCTFTKEENEEVIENALNSKFKIEILNLDLDILESKKAIIGENSLARRIIGNYFAQSFFICKIRKNG